MSLRFAFSRSGGMVYHMIARRRSRGAWRPFKSHVSSWITTWLETAGPCDSPATQLIVFGPSAGWTLPLADFAQLQKLTFVEPDPIARFLLRQRLRANGAKTFEILPNADLLPWFSKDDQSFKQFLDENKQAAILFANVLGQISLIARGLSNDRAIEARKEFLRALSDRNWASYHDLYSGPSLESRSLNSNVTEPLEPLKAAEHVFTVGGDVIDHETEWLGRPRAMALWPLTEKLVHIIGFVQSR